MQCFRSSSICLIRLTHYKISSLKGNFFDCLKFVQHGFTFYPRTKINAIDIASYYAKGAFSDVLKRVI